MYDIPFFKNCTRCQDYLRFPWGHCTCCFRCNILCETHNPLQPNLCQRCGENFFDNQLCQCCYHCGAKCQRLTFSGDYNHTGEAPGANSLGYTGCVKCKERVRWPRDPRCKCCRKCGDTSQCKKRCLGPPRREVLGRVAG